MSTQLLHESLSLMPALALAIGPLVDKLLSQMTLWGSVFSLAGLFFALVAIWVFRRRGLLRRIPQWWNVAAKLSYLLVLIALPLAGAAGGALFGAERLLLRAVDVGVRPLLEAEMPAFRASIVERFGPMTEGTLVTVRDVVQPLVQNLTYKPRSDSFIESIKARVVNELLLKETAALLTDVIHERIRNAGRVASAITKDWNGDYPVEQVIKFLTGAGEHMDFSDLDRTIPEVVCEGVGDQISSIFKGFYMTTGLALIFITILIVAEMLFYFKRYVPGRQKRDLLPSV